MSSLRIASILAILTFCLVGAFADNQYVQNGGFETGDLSNWVVDNPYGLYYEVVHNEDGLYNNSDAGDWFFAFGTAPTGTAAFTSDGLPVPTVNITLAQDIVVPEYSNQFLLSFYLYNENIGNGRFVVVTGFDGVNTTHLPASFTRVTTTPVAPKTQPYVHYSLLITAPSTMTNSGQFILAFIAQTDTGYYQLDNVTLIGPSIVGDPQFVGLRGQSFQVHGMDGEVYNLISDDDLQVNSRFVFLTEGECPIIKSRKASNCWSHSGSYLGAIGIQQVIDGAVEKLSLLAGDAKTGFAEILINGKAMSAGDVYQNGGFVVAYNASHMVIVDTPSFSFRFENSDLFINQQVIANKPLSQMTAHGLFGQTHVRKIYSSSLKYIAGEADDYAISDNDLFGTDFVYNRFKA